VDGTPVGVVVCKIDEHRGKRRGYLGMLVVKPEYRRKLGLGAPHCVPCVFVAQPGPPHPLRRMQGARWCAR